MSLADASQRRDAGRTFLANGVDLSEKKEDKIERRSASNFESNIRQWHASNKKWGEETSKQILGSLELHIFPHIVKDNISNLTVPALLASIKIVEEKNHLDMTRRLKLRVTAIMRYAVQHGIINHNLANDLTGAIVIREATHRPTLPLNRIPDLLNNIDSYRSRQLTNLALKLSLLVFIRSRELRFARWNEIDFERSLWVIPAERKKIPGVKFSYRGSKMRTEHLVPLSKQGIEVLRQIQEISGQHELIFIGDHYADKPMSEGTIKKAL